MRYSLYITILDCGWIYVCDITDENDQRLLRHAKEAGLATKVEVRRADSK